MRLHTGVSPKFTLADFVDDVDDAHQYGPTVAKNKWLTLMRVGTTVSLKIYNDSGRADLNDTLTINQSLARSYRYLYPATSLNLATFGNDYLTFSVSDLLIGE